MQGVNSTKTTDVLIVGGGPVGLGLAIEFGMRNIRCIVVEMRDGKVRVPKMSQVTSRSMEFCRRWGIVDKVERAGWPSSHPFDFAYVTSLTGFELARSEWPPYEVGAERHYTPNGTAHCPQIFFDPILMARVLELPKVEVQARTKMISFVDEGNLVRTELRDEEHGQEESIVSRYLVGCDGAESNVRGQLGIAFEGEGHLGHSVSIFFRSPDLATLHDKGWARFYRMIDETGHWADLVSIDGKDLWRLTLLDLGSRAEIKAVDTASMLWRAAGVEFTYEILSVLPWERRDLLAATYGKGRVYICGDAAHVLSPTGGLGMNTGLADACDLSWKIAAAIEGWAGPHLLATYDTERRAIAQRNVKESTDYFRRTRVLFPKGRPLAERTPEGRLARQDFAEDFERLSNEDALYVSEHVKIGYGYEPSSICIADGTPGVEATGMDYVPNARPGARAPHVWLKGGHSLLDIFGFGFVLLRLGRNPPSVASMVAEAEARHMPLQVFDLVHDEAERIYEKRLTLVRPDGHVCWRSDCLPETPGDILDRVRGFYVE
jgi:2-polyprenyl-6-methoxyphenol hydroxylase-like FAD-dependent oxidoreductase